MSNLETLAHKAVVSIRGARRAFKIVLDREVDGRWIANVTNLPKMGCAVYGTTRFDAVEKAKAAALWGLSQLSREEKFKIPSQLTFVVVEK